MMLSALKIIAAASAAGLAIFMMIMGYISWWFAPVMLAWNISPLVVAYIFTARTSWSPVPLSMLLFAIGYVIVAALIYYDWFFRQPPGMNGFAYLLVPFLGWIGLPCACTVASLITVIQKLRGV